MGNSKMGKQIRKVMPWTNMAEAHLVTGHTIHRMYRWSTYFSHPQMTPGGPFKFRGSSTPYIGSLSTPDIVKYKIPIPLAFPPNPNFNPAEQSVKTYPRTTDLVKAGNYKNDTNCQKQIQNFNKCVTNNRDNA